MADDADALRVDPDERARAPRRRRKGSRLLLAVAATAAVAGWWWWDRQEAQHAVAPPSAATAPAPAPQAPPEEAVESGPRHPLEAVDPSQPLAAGEVEPALAALLGHEAVRTFLQASDFPRRVVATVDNLGRAHASPAMWPVHPASGRFSVEAGAQGEVIAADNAQRYAPFVRFVSAVDAAQAAALYRRMYPLLQQSYRELGFGGRYFNDRLVEVIDQLLAAPEPQAPPQVRLVEVKGPIASQRPWVRYEFVDPRLEAATAGQKMLVRMGLEQQRALKRKLAEFRRHVAVGAPGAR